MNMDLDFRPKIKSSIVPIETKDKAKICPNYPRSSKLISLYGDAGD